MATEREGGGMVSSTLMKRGGSFSHAEGGGAQQVLPTFGVVVMQ